MIHEEIDKRLKEIYEEYKKDEKDLTSWSLNQKIKEEANFNQYMIDCFKYRMSEIALEKKEVIINFIVDLIELSCFYYQSPEIVMTNKSNEKFEIFPQIFLRKGLLIKILEKLNFQKTIKIFGLFLISREEKDKGVLWEKYSSEEEINILKNKDRISINFIIDTFNQEYKKLKVRENKKIIELVNNIT